MGEKKGGGVVHLDNGKDYRSNEIGRHQLPQIIEMDRWKRERDRDRARRALAITFALTLIASTVAVLVTMFLRACAVTP